MPSRVPSPCRAPKHEGHKQRRKSKGCIIKKHRTYKKQDCRSGVSLCGSLFFGMKDMACKTWHVRHCMSDITATKDMHRKKRRNILSGGQTRSKQQNAADASYVCGRSLRQSFSCPERRRRRLILRGGKAGLPGTSAFVRKSGAVRSQPAQIRSEAFSPCQNRG